MKRLLVINFVYDLDDPVLGFAVEWVHELSAHFDETVVLTGRAGRFEPSPRISIISTNWQTGRNVHNSIDFLRALAKILRSSRPSVAFTHMAVAQGLVASPLLRLFRIRHVLWYTHRKLTMVLRLAVFMSNSVLTASPETCRVRSRKVAAIGHGISAPPGRLADRRGDGKVLYVTWGRCDPVKRLDNIVAAINEVHSTDPSSASLLVIGDPSSQSSREWWDAVMQDDQRRARIIEWIPAVSRDRLTSQIPEDAIFVHSSRTGLDKAPLEAALLGLPVLSDEPLILEALDANRQPLSLEEQIKWCRQLADTDRLALVALQRIAVERLNSLSNLINRVSQELELDR